MSQPYKIAVLGGGFGGVYAFKQLHQALHRKSPIELTLINRTNYFLFTPLLHEVATGGISPENIVESLRKIFECCAYTLSITEADSIDLKKQCIQTPLGKISYDYLIYAAGATTNFFNTPGAEQHCFTLKSLDDATRLKNHFIRTVERASHIKNRQERKRLLQFVIIGGGATGVELAAETAEYMYDTFRRAYARAAFIDDITIHLLQRDAHLLPQFSEKLRAKSEEVLRKKGVQVHCQAVVVSVDSDGITLHDGSRIETATPIWVAGVRPHDIEVMQTVERDAQGRLVVENTLQLKGHENVFVIGDSASLQGPEGRIIPPLAQVAVQAASVAARNVLRHIEGKSLSNFTFKNKGSLVSLGQWMALAELQNLSFAGHFAWWFWRTVYLSKLISWDHKIKVAIDWTLDLFFPRDISDV